MHCFSRAHVLAWLVAMESGIGVVCASEKPDEGSCLLQQPQVRLDTIRSLVNLLDREATVMHALSDTIKLDMPPDPADKPAEAAQPESNTVVEVTETKPTLLAQSLAPASAPLDSASNLAAPAQGQAGKSVESIQQVVDMQLLALQDKSNAPRIEPAPMVLPAGSLEGLQVNAAAPYSGMQQLEVVRNGGQSSHSLYQAVPGGNALQAFYQLENGMIVPVGEQPVHRIEGVPIFKPPEAPAAWPPQVAMNPAAVGASYTPQATEVFSWPPMPSRPISLQAMQPTASPPTTSAAPVAAESYLETRVKSLFKGLAR